MPISSSSSSSNIVVINVVEPSFKVKKTSNKDNVKIGDTFFYNIEILNDGDYAASSTILTDILPSAFTVIEITSNGIPVIGDLSAGIDLGPLDTGDSFNVLIKIKVATDIYEDNGFRNLANVLFTVTLDPADPPTTISVNTLSETTLRVFNPDLELLKTPNLLDVAVGDTVTYTINVINSGNIALTDIIVRDLLDPCLKFVNNSITVDNVPLTTTNIMSGVKFKILLPGESRKIQFKVVIGCNESSIKTNTATAQYNYILDCDAYAGTGFATSNVTELNVIYSHVTITKKAIDFTGCKLSQNSVITYSIELLNDGDVDITNFILRDKLPMNVVLIEDSFLINDVASNIKKGDLRKGVSLGPIPMGESTTFIFNVRVSLNSCCISCNTLVENIANGIYYFELPDGTSRYRLTDTATSQLRICSNK